MTDKSSLRAELLKKRFLLSDKRRKEASENAFLFFQEKFSKTSEKVLSFASISSEIDLWPLNLWLMEKKRLLLPKVEKETLEIYEVTCPQELKVCYAQIQEPNPLLCHKADFEKKTVILVPALGFDKDFHRIGYGKGHYDRFLAGMSRFLKWGVGFKEQECDKIYTEPHDLPLDQLFLF